VKAAAGTTESNMSKTFGPFLEVARIQSEINHLFENLMDLEHANADSGGWVPNVDILETPDGLVVKVELPGVRSSDLEVTVGGGMLTVQGDKRAPDDPGDVEHVQLERVYGRFRRAIHLGAPVNTRLADAVLADGVLRLRFPKVPNRRGEELSIEVKSV